MQSRMTGVNDAFAALVADPTQANRDTAREQALLYAIACTGARSLESIRGQVEEVQLTGDTNAILSEAVTRDYAIVARALAEAKKRVAELETWLNRLQYVLEQVAANERTRRETERHLEDYSTWALTRVDGIMAENLHTANAQTEVMDLVDYQAYEWVMRATSAIQTVETRARDPQQTARGDPRAE